MSWGMEETPGKKTAHDGATGREALLLFVGMLLFATAIFLLRSPVHAASGSDSTLLAIQSHECVEAGWCNTDNVHLSRIGPPHGALWHYVREVALLSQMGPDELLTALGVSSAFAIALLCALLSLFSGWRWAVMAGLVWLWFWDAPVDLWNPALIPWTSSLMLVAASLAIQLRGLHLVFIAGLMTGLGTQAHLLLALFGVAILPVIARAFEGNRRFAAYGTWIISFLGAMQVWAPTMTLGLHTGDVSWNWLWVMGAVVPGALLLFDWLLHMAWLPGWLTSRRGLVGLCSLTWMVAGLLAFLLGPAEARNNSYYYIPAGMGAMVYLALVGHLAQKKLRCWFDSISPPSPVTDPSGQPKVPPKSTSWARTVWAAVSVCLVVGLTTDAVIDRATRRPVLALSPQEVAAFLARAKVAGLATMQQVRESVVTGPDMSSFWWETISVWPSVPKVAPLESSVWVEAGEQGLRRRLLLVPNLTTVSYGWERIPRLEGEVPILARTERALIDRGHSWTCVSHPDEGTCECRPFHAGTCDIAQSDALWPLRWICFYRQRVFQSSAQGKADLFSVWPLWPPDVPASAAIAADSGDPETMAQSLGVINRQLLPGKNWLIPPLDVAGSCPGYALPNEAFETPQRKPWSLATRRTDARPDEPLVTWHPIRNSHCAEKLIQTQQDVPMPIPDGPSEYIAPLLNMPQAGQGPDLPESFPDGLPQACQASMASWRPPESLEKAYPDTRPSRIWVAPEYVLLAAFAAVAMLLIASLLCVAWLSERRTD